jgi:hypothetical protein
MNKTHNFHYSLPHCTLLPRQSPNNIVILLYLEELHKNTFRVQFLRVSYSIHTIGMNSIEFMQLLELKISHRDRKSSGESNLISKLIASSTGYCYPLFYNSVEYYFNILILLYLVCMFSNYIIGIKKCHYPHVTMRDFYLRGGLHYGNLTQTSREILYPYQDERSKRETHSDKNR